MRRGGTELRRIWIRNASCWGPEHPGAARGCGWRGGAVGRGNGCGQDALHGHRAGAAVGWRACWRPAERGRAPDPRRISIFGHRGLKPLISGGCDPRACRSQDSARAPGPPHVLGSGRLCRRSCTLRPSPALLAACHQLTRDPRAFSRGGVSASARWGFWTRGPGSWSSSSRLRPGRIPGAYRGTPRLKQGATPGRCPPVSTPFAASRAGRAGGAVSPAVGWGRGGGHGKSLRIAQRWQLAGSGKVVFHRAQLEQQLGASDTGWDGGRGGGHGWWLPEDRP